MTYIVRVVGYNAYWTNDTSPGKCWTFDINEAYHFDNKEDPQKIIDSGNNMEVVEYSSAIPQAVELKSSPDLQWKKVDEAQLEFNKRKAKQSHEEFVDLSPEEFKEDSIEMVEEVDVEVIE